MAIYLDPASGQKFIEGEDGELMLAPDVAGEFRPFGISTGMQTPGALNAALITAGSGIEDLREGVAQIGNLFSRDPAREEFLAERNQERRDLLAPVAAEYPWASMGGAVVPALATLPLTGGRVAQGVIGGAQGAMTYDPNKSILRRAMEGAAWGTGGATLSEIGGNVISRIARSGDQAIAQSAARKAAQDVKRLGGYVTKGQEIDSESLRQLEVGLARNPMTRAPFDEGARLNQQIVNGAAAKAIGVDPATLTDGRITMEALAQADDQLSTVFDNVGLSMGQIDMGEDFGKRVLSLEQFRKLRALGDLEGLEKGVLGSNDYQVVRQALVEESQQAAARGQGRLKEKIWEMVDGLDQEAERYIGPDDMENFARAREQWRNLKVLEQSNVLDADGNVRPGLLASRLKSNYGKTFTQGREDRVLPETAALMDTARTFSNPKVRPIVGSSGTGETIESSRILGQMAGAAQGDPGSAKELALEVARGTIYRALPPETLDAFLKSGDPAYLRAGGTAGRSIDEE